MMPFKGSKALVFARKLALMVFNVVTFSLIFCNFLIAEDLKPVLIGASVSLEGRHKIPSFMVVNAYRLWEKQVNDRGGILGRPVRLILKDDKSSLQRVREVYEELIVKEHVDIVLAPYGSPLTMMASEVSERHKKLMLACSASSEQLWDRGFQYLVGMYATADRYFIGFLDLVARNGLDTVGVVFENSPFTRDAAEGAIKWAERFNIRVVFAESYRDCSKSFESIIDRLSKIKPDALLLSAYPDDCYEFLGVMKKKKFQIRALGMTIAPVFPDFCEKAGSMCEGVFAPAQWVPSDRIPYPGSKKFIRNFKEFTGVMPSYHAASCYAACKILEQAINDTKTLNQESLLRYILGLNTVSIIGRFRVSHIGKQMGHVPLTIQWQSGKQEIVYPLSIQTAPPVFRYLKAGESG